MATLTINGKQVKVDDSFLSLSPDEQNKTVDEISSQLSSAPAAQPSDAPPVGAVPGSQAYKDWAIQQARAGKPLPQISQSTDQSLPTQIEAGLTSAANSIPIAGPAAKTGLEMLKSAVQGVPQSTIAADDTRNEQNNPVASTIGDVTGTVLPFMAGGEIPLVAKLLGMDSSVPLLLRSLLGGASQSGISYADNLMRGADQGQAAQNSIVPGVVGSILPGAGVALGKLADLAPRAANWLTGGAVNTLRNMRSPTQAAEKLVGRSYTSDLLDNKTAMDPVTETLAQNSGLPITNLDRGGSVTRSLARTAANVSPDARATLESSVDRGAASSRATDFLTNLVGGSADDLALREGLRNTARIVNAPAYKAAEAAPAAQNILTPGIQQLMQAPEMQQAIKEAEGIGKTRAAIGNAAAPKAPFKFDVNGNLVSTPIAPPSLPFWDNVQQALRRQIEGLGPKERARLSDLTQLRNGLLGELDSAVPQYQVARQGAARFFGAEDAMDAGRNFATARGQVPEAQAAFAKFSPSEQKAFGIGWASSLVDKLGTKDGYAIIKQTFENPNARKMAQMALGSGKADQLESYLKAEQIMQGSSDALKGNSSTARQLAMLGAVGIGTGGYGAATGDWRPLTAATLLTAGRSGLQYLGKSVDQKVMNEVANLLVSGNRQDLMRVTANATMSPKWRDALNAIFNGMGAGARGVVDSQARPAPVQITVNGGAGTTR